MYEILNHLEAIFGSAPSLTGLVASYIAGVVVSFSPCIYPLIPITLGVIGVTTAQSKIKGFTLSVIFVLGISFTYTLIGIAASFFGILLQKFFYNSATQGILTAVFLVLGLNLLDVLKINIPFFNVNYPPQRKGAWVFVLGLISGFAVIPCNFPVLGAILALISTRKDVFYAGACLFLFSIGYGTILILLGTFSSLVKKLPKQGNWLLVSKKISGIILLLVALYFFSQFIGGMK